MAIQVNTNEALIENRSKIGLYTSLVGLALVFGSVLAAFQNNILLAYGAMLTGFVLSNIGAYFLNRYAMGAYKKLEDSLKGFDKRYRLYNYLLPAPNVMLTPYGVTVFALKNQDGTIIGNAKGWRQGSSIVRFLRSLSSEPLGDPPRDLAAQKAKMSEFIAEKLGQENNVPVDGFVVFTNDKADVTLSDVKAPVIVLNKNPDALKSALRRDKRTPTMPAAQYEQLVSLFDQEAEIKTERAERGFRFWQR